MEHFIKDIFPLVVLIAIIFVTLKFGGRTKITSKINRQASSESVGKRTIPDQELITSRKQTEKLEEKIRNEQLNAKKWNIDFTHELEKLLVNNRLDIELLDKNDFDVSSHLRNNELLAYQWLTIFFDSLENGIFDDIFYIDIASQFDLKKIRDSYVRCDTAQKAYLEVFSWVNLRFFHDEIQKVSSGHPYTNFYLVILEHQIKKSVKRVWDTR